MSKIVFLSFLALLLMSGCGLRVRAAAPPDWVHYTNVRFAFAACYPGNLLAAQGESPDSDGEKFLGSDGATLTVYGSNNIDHETMPTAFARAREALSATGVRIRYQLLKRDMFVVSGISGSSVVYEKRIAGAGALKTMLMTYPAALRGRYDHLIGHIARCFANTSPTKSSN